MQHHDCFMWRYGSNPGFAHAVQSFYQLNHSLSSAPVFPCLFVYRVSCDSGLTRTQYRAKAGREFLLLLLLLKLQVCTSTILGNFFFFLRQALTQQQKLAWKSLCNKGCFQMPGQSPAPTSSWSWDHKHEPLCPV